ncbi:MAG: M23 family metallopeptidase [Leptospirales bacterium]|nr:M23 family metallopeptidase [Leptospirales bacterium]
MVVLRSDGRKWIDLPLGLRHGFGLLLLLAAALSMAVVASLASASAESADVNTPDEVLRNGGQELNEYRRQLLQLRNLQRSIAALQFPETYSDYNRQRDWLRSDLTASSTAQVALIDDRMVMIEARLMSAETLPFAAFYNFYLRSYPHAAPLENALRITSGFGMRPNPFGRSSLNEMHRGVDLRARRGAPVLCAAAGIVSRIEFRSDGYGNNVRVLHNSGYETIYAHLQSIYVHRGQELDPGQLIGLAGASGAATGPHLHYELRRHDQSLDPRPFLPL